MGADKYHWVLVDALKVYIVPMFWEPWASIEAWVQGTWMHKDCNPDTFAVHRSCPIHWVIARWVWFESCLEVHALQALGRDIVGQAWYWPMSCYETWSLIDVADWCYC